MNFFSNSRIILLIFISLFLFSCKKQNGSSNETGTITLPASTPVNGSVVAKIIDENESPVTNSSVKIGNSSYTTDVNGMISTGNIVLDKYTSCITASKQGYYQGYRSFCATASTNYIVIKLIKRTLVNSFNSATATTVTLNNGTQIFFPENAVVIKNSGAVYSGTVNVYADYIDPTSSDISKTIPGSFVGIDDGKLYALQSKGMIAVELETDAGESLQLAPAKLAHIKMPIPAILQATAPATIATWNLNEQGFWAKDSSAAKNGNDYDFDVSHFSFWNLDIPIDAIYLSMNVKDQAAQNLANVVIILEAGATSGYGSSYGYTDAQGNVAGIVPKNVVMSLRVQFAAINCTNALYAQTVGPFTSDASLNIVATVPASQSLTVKGNVTNCAGLPATSGYIYVQKNNDSLNTLIAMVSNGQFTIDVPHCDAISTITILTYAGVIPQQPQSITYNVNSSLLDVGNIVFCDSAYQGYIMYQIDGTSYTHIEERNGTLVWALLDQSLNSTIISVSDPGTTSTQYLSGAAAGTSVGTFPYDQNVLLSVEGFANSNTVSNAASVSLTSYGNVGEYVSGNFNIPFTDAFAVNHSFTGTFKLKRFQ